MSALTAREEVALSNRRQESVRDFWERAHRQNGLQCADRPIFPLSGYGGEDIWRRLEVDHLVREGAKVLNIGIGMGHCTRALAERRCVVHALDIARSALDKVSDIATTWHVDDLDRLPKDFFSLAISHLVAQHMSTPDLQTQMQAVIASLTPDGLFAIQFATQMDDRAAISKDAKGGGVVRSPETMAALAQSAGGRVVMSVPKDTGEGWAWYVIQIARAN